MGRATRPKPKRLAEKLLQIRTALGLSQNQLIRRLGFADEITQDYISATSVELESRRCLCC